MREDRAKRTWQRPAIVRLDQVDHTESGGFIGLAETQTGYVGRGRGTRGPFTSVSYGSVS